MATANLTLRPQLALWAPPARLPELQWGWKARSRARLRRKPSERHALKVRDAGVEPPRQEEPMNDISVYMLGRPRFRLSLFVVICFVPVMPLRALAYGDPSGGFLFQMLTPLVAVLWGSWLIFAGKIRKRLRKVIYRMRGVAVDDSITNAAQDGQNPE